MFDSAPSNLPVEPGATPTPAPAVPAAAPEPVPAPAPAAPAPRPLSTGTLKKEPEDIFSGLDTGGSDAQVDAAVQEMVAEDHHSPLKFILLAFLIVVVVGGIGTGVWYFFIRQAPVETGIVTPTSTANSPVVTSNSEPVVETPPALPPESGSTVPPTIPLPDSIATSTPTVPTTPTTPTVQMTEALDTDGDGLSDPEEAVVGTELTMADSDGDGFTDGSELQNGYDPAAVKIAISSSPRYHEVMISSTLGVFVPLAWTSQVDTASQNGTIIQTGTPTSFSLMLADRPANSTFADWLAVNEPTADPSIMRTFTTRAGYVAHMTFDRLHSYIEVPGSVVVVTYRAGSSTTYDFRAIYDHIVQTLRVR